jgi:hypothetical protein
MDAPRKERTKMKTTNKPGLSVKTNLEAARF